MRIVLVATGGTIASRATADGLVAAARGAELLSGLEADRLPAGAQVEAVDVGTRSSSALTLADMHAIAEVVLGRLEAGADGLVVTHGTDSLEETAFLLDLLHQGDAPIVVTGAQRAFDHPDPDGPGNLAAALAQAASSSARGRGVLVAFGGHVLPARGVRKVDTVDLLAFANPDHAATATTPDGAPPDTPRRSSIPGAADRLRGLTPPQVAVVAAVPGDTGQGLRDAVANGAAGIIFQALGIGNATLEDAAAIGAVVDAGVPVLVTTRVPHGGVRPVYGNGGGRTLEEAGGIFAGHLTTWQARILLSVHLALDPWPASRQPLLDWLARHQQE